MFVLVFFFFFQAEDGIRDADVTGVQTCALPICNKSYFQIFISICFIVYLLYFYTITLFNLCVRKFEKRIFFDEKIIKHFKNIGFIFITNFIIVFLLDRMFVIHSEKVIQASTNFSSTILTKLEAPLGSLILGFFFLVLSQVFKEAKKQKEENELTI